MIALSPEKMTTAEKLQAMELLWSDLCSHSQLTTPDWHQTVLEKRHQQRENGTQQPMAWSEAKEAIRQRTR
ncbi:MAG: addiction module protein [Gammaproteobacteria bacterium]|nr:addiction module protein [Gammaproteobacteria bacterium]